VNLRIFEYFVGEWRRRAKWSFRHFYYVADVWFISCKIVAIFTSLTYHCLSTVSV